MLGKFRNDKNGQLFPLAKPGSVVPPPPVKDHWSQIIYFTSSNIYFLLALQEHLQDPEEIKKKKALAIRELIIG